MVTPQYDIHTVSCKLQSITSQSQGFRKMLKDSLIILLKPIDGEYPWSKFSWNTGQGSRTDTFSSFPDYLEKWSRYTMADLRDIFRNDNVILDKLDRVEQRPNGVHAFDNIQSVPPTGTSKDAGLRRLRKDRPDLHAEVLSGERTVHNAMIEAGFREKTYQIKASRESVLAFCSKHQIFL